MRKTIWSRQHVLDAFVPVSMQRGSRADTHLQLMFEEETAIGQKLTTQNLQEIVLESPDNSGPWIRPNEYALPEKNLYRTFVAESTPCRLVRKSLYSAALSVRILLVPNLFLFGFFFARFHQISQMRVGGGGGSHGQTLIDNHSRLKTLQASHGATQDLLRSRVSPPPGVAHQSPTDQRGQGAPRGSGWGTSGSLVSNFSVKPVM